MEKIKVLQVNKLYYPVVGGIERVVQEISEGLSGSVDIKVLACQKKGKSTHETMNNVPVLKASSFGMAFSTPVSLSFFYWFNQLKYDRDILHIHMPFPLADVAMCLFGFKGKVVLWWHSDVVKQKKLLLFYKPFLKRLLKRADIIMVATKGHIDGSDYLPHYRDKCVIIPYGVDSALLEKSQTIVETPKPQSSPLSFLFVGRFVYYKGCEVLLEAFAKVSGASLTLIGEGPLESQLKTQADNLGIVDKVQFLGNVSDDVLAQAFADCDVFVLPSIAKSEAFGLVQIEAMAYGKPVINTNLPSGVPYVSLDGQTGFTVAPSDPDDLSNAMQKLIDDPDLRKQFGEAAYKRARQEFSMDKMLDDILAQYEKLVKQGVI